MNVKSEAKLSLFEATSIIVGHGVGSGILSVPFLAAHNSLRELLLCLLLGFLVNVLLHFLISELSYNNGGAQFVTCFDTELFSGRLKKGFTWAAFVLLAVSVLFNVSAFLTGAAAVFRSWLGLKDLAGMLLFYALGAGVVFAGLKLVGICEKIAVTSMLGVVLILLFASLGGERQALPGGFHGMKNAVALFGLISFSLSAVMSVPQVVKGLHGDAKKIRLSIVLGIGINCTLILLITLATLFGAGQSITGDGALVDLANALGGWVSIVGYVFTLLALATSFWANSLDLRDILSEQLHIGKNLSWLLATAPCLLLAFLRLSSFVGLVRFASVIQIVTGAGVILAYARSRKRVGTSDILGSFGTLPFQILIAIAMLTAALGAVLPVS